MLGISAVERGHAPAPCPPTPPGGLPCAVVTLLDPAVAADLAALDAALAGAPDADPELAALASRTCAPPRRGRRRPSARASTSASPPGSRPRGPAAQRRAGGPRGPARRVRRRARVAAALGARRGAAWSRSSSPADSALRARSGGGAGRAGVVGREPARLRAPARRWRRPARRRRAAPPPVGRAARGTAAGPATLAPGRRVERSTRLELGTTAGRFAAVTDGVVRATQRAGGFVAVLAAPAGRRGAARDVRPARPGRAAGGGRGRPQPPRPRPLDRAGRDGPHGRGRPHDVRPARRPDAATARSSPRWRRRPGPRDPPARSDWPRADARARGLDRAPARAAAPRAAYATVDLSVTRAPAAGAARRPRRPLDAGRRLARRAAGARGRAGVAIVVARRRAPAARCSAAAAVAAGRALRRRRREAALGG